MVFYKHRKFLTAVCFLFQKNELNAVIFEISPHLLHIPGSATHIIKMLKAKNMRHMDGLIGYTFQADTQHCVSSKGRGEPISKTEHDFLFLKKAGGTLLCCYQGRGFFRYVLYTPNLGLHMACKSSIKIRIAFFLDTLFFCMF